MRLLYKFFAGIHLLYNLTKVILKFLWVEKKNIFFIEGGFGVISTHCHLISLMNKKDNLLVWLIKKNLIQLR